MPAPRTGERVWRARKSHTWIDAQLHTPVGSDGVELRFFYDGRLMLSRVWPTREAAVAYARHQLNQLQRAGWNSHW